MATVYLARDLKHDRPVALKVLHADLSHAVGTERFLREIKLAARLQHPDILTLYDSGETAGLLWFTMPYVEGESLRQRLVREPQLPLDEAVRIATTIAGALAYAHRDGVIHRDVKPENILLSGDRCMLADFGVARALDVAGGEKLTETGLALGTPAYMSPEQASAEAHLDNRSDIYSLGCVFYEMLVGEPPFTGRTAQAIIARRFSEPAPRVRPVRDVSEAVDLVVSKSLARSPADRFLDAAAFAAALQAAAQAPSGMPMVATHRLASRKGVALATVGIAAAVAFALGVRRGDRRTAETALDANLLAVAPFDVLDPRLELWREGLVDVLSRDLDGAGPLRTVPQTVVIRRWQGRADQPSAEALGRSTGAGVVVFGSVIGKGPDSVALRARAIDLRDGSRPTDVEVVGATARMGELADSLGVEVLRSLGRTRPIGAVRQATIGSRTLPALRAFLQGEQFYRKGLWDSAIAAYDRAIIEDSAFALAHRRMGLVLSWHSPSWRTFEPAASYTARAARLNHRMPARDSLLITAAALDLAADDATDGDSLLAVRTRAWSTLETAAQRFPGDPEVWYELGESRYHSQIPMIPSRALDAFERSIKLDPGFGPAYEHTIQLAIILRDPSRAHRYASTYALLNPTGEASKEIELTLRVLNPTFAQSAETDRLQQKTSVHALFRTGYEHLGSWTDSAETSIRVLRELAAGGHALGSAPWVDDSMMWANYLSKALAFRGHLSEAYRTYQPRLLRPDTNPWASFSDPLLELALLKVVPADAAKRIFGKALEPSEPWPSNPYIVDRRLRGLPWCFARGDTLCLRRFAARAEQEASRATSPIVRLRARYLGKSAAAYLKLARNDSTGALIGFQGIPESLCLVNVCFFEKLTQARLLASKGEFRVAEELMDRWLWDLSSSPFTVLATLERGRIAERLGDRDKAVDNYRFVTAAWQNADAELQPYVSEANAALVRLRTE